VNQTVGGLILLNKPNTGLRGFIKKKNKKNGTDRTRQHSAGMVYYTYLTHFAYCIDGTVANL